MRTEALQLNADHFTGHRFIQSVDEIPVATGGMYRHYLNDYFNWAK